MHFPRPQKTEIGNPEINNIEDKFKDKNEFILNNYIRIERGNQITDMIQYFESIILG